MNSAIVLLLCAAAAYGQVQQETLFSCSPGSEGVENYDVMYQRRVYKDTFHASHFLSIEMDRQTDLGYSITACFDTAQCVTSGFASYLYMATQPNAANMTGMRCVDLVPPKELSPKLAVGDKVYFSFETHSTSNAGAVTFLFINGNGVVEGSRATSVPPQDVNDVCLACDGAYVADKDDCASFHHCFNNQAYHFKCPMGTFWDDSLKTCNWMTEAGCLRMNLDGTRRFQCKNVNGDCQAADPAAPERSPYTKTLILKGCSHASSPPPPASGTVAPP